MTGGYAIVGGAPASARSAAASMARGAVVSARSAVSGAATGARGAAGRARSAATGAATSVRGAINRDRPDQTVTDPGDPATAAGSGAAGVAGAATTPDDAAADVPAARAGVAPRSAARKADGDRPRGSRAETAAARIAGFLQRDRTELLSGAVLALAILAALTSWGALDIATAAAEPAPILLGGQSD